MTDDSPVKIGAVLLAAGGSSRFGRPKQLVEYRGETLIRRAAEMLTRSACSRVVVVLGAEIECSVRELAGLTVLTCINDRWSDGISSSIKSGLARILEIEPKIAAVVIALCDQPFVTTDDINQLVEMFRESGSPIVASKYADTVGVPALFAAEVFDGLRSLNGDEGARRLIRQDSDLVSTVEIRQAAIDIDSPVDVRWKADPESA